VAQSDAEEVLSGLRVATGVRQTADDDRLHASFLLLAAAVAVAAAGGWRLPHTVATATAALARVERWLLVATGYVHGSPQ